MILLQPVPHLGQMQQVLSFVGAPLSGGACAPCNFWRRAAPFFVRYKYAEWRINAEEGEEAARETRWNRIHEHSAAHPR